MTIRNCTSHDATTSSTQTDNVISLSQFAAIPAHAVVTDLTVCFSSITLPGDLDPCKWHRVQKDLYLYTSQHRSAWICVALANETDLAADDLLVVDIEVGEQPPNPGQDQSWESRPCGIWVLRNKFNGKNDQAVTEVDVLFGTDAVDPRPQWSLMDSPLQLEAEPDLPVARLSVLRGKPEPFRRRPLRVKQDGKFKIVQISDTHMVTGVGTCRDAIDAYGRPLPPREADPLTVNLIKSVLDIESPDLVILSGDQLHHDIPDSQSALFKITSPFIERAIPFAAVFGNHDSEGSHALSRTAQMSILQRLPYSLCEPGPSQVDGIGNFYLNVLAPAPSRLPLSTLYFLDSHGQIPNESHNPDYETISESQIEWFTNASQGQRIESQRGDFHLSLVFLHIPLPEFGDPRLKIYTGARREPTESPSVNSGLYRVLAREGILAIGCGHDHVNDFCALLPSNTPSAKGEEQHLGPWLCYGGGSGFGGYCSYADKRFHRRMRVWELDTNDGSVRTWLRVQYTEHRVCELILAEGGMISHASTAQEDDGLYVVNHGG